MRRIFCRPDVVFGEWAEHERKGIKKKYGNMMRMVDIVKEEEQRWN